MNFGPKDAYYNFVFTTDYLPYRQHTQVRDVRRRCMHDAYQWRCMHYLY